MIYSFLKTALRAFLREKVSSTINLVCLSLAVSCCIVAYLFIDNHLNREWYHENALNIFMVGEQAFRDGSEVRLGATPVPLGAAIAVDIPGIERVVRVARGSATVNVNGNEFQESVRFVDPEFLEMFTLPLVHGDASGLQSNQSIFVSLATAKKYFGDDQPLGKEILVSMNGMPEKMFVVAGVTQPIPSQSCVEFSFFVNYTHYIGDVAQQDEWRTDTQATFIQLTNTTPGELGRITGLLSRYAVVRNAAMTADKKTTGFFLENLLTLKANAGSIKQSIAGRSISWAPVVLYGSIASLLLLLGCFNFINVSMASAAARIKEIGIRKVIGGNRIQLIIQFLFENALLCGTALLLGIAITGSFLLPAFDEMVDQGLQLDFSSRVNLWFYLVSLLAFVAILSGLYPALYISSFKPVTILRGRHRFGDKSLFMQSLLGFQLALSFITVIVCAALLLNVDDLRNRDWGYDEQNLFSVRVKSEDQFSLMTKTATELGTVERVSGAHQHIGVTNNESKILVNGNEKHAIIFDVDESYFNVLGLSLSAGRLPAARHEVVVNETFLAAHQVDVNQQEVFIDSVAFSIVGIVKDFHHDHFGQDIEPLIFKQGQAQFYEFVVVRTNTEASQSIRKMEAVWKDNFKGVPFSVVRQTDVFDELFAETRQLTSMFVFTAVLALLMSAVGLFGLAAQRMHAKLKEIAIRKIFGLSAIKAMFLVNARFLITLAVAAVIATPVSYILIGGLLDNYYTYHMTVGPVGFLIGYAVVLVTMIIALIGKAREVYVGNPAEMIRND